MLESEENSKKSLASYHIQVTPKQRGFSVTFKPKAGGFVQEPDPSHKVPKYSDCLLAEDELKYR